MRYRNVKLKYPTIYKMLHYNITQHSTFTHYFITLEYFTTVGTVKELCNPFRVLGRTPKDYIRLQGRREGTPKDYLGSQASHGLSGRLAGG